MPAVAEPLPGGFEAGLRVGYGLQGGKATGTDSNQDSYLPTVVPIVIDVGYRIAPRWFIGGFAQYAFGVEYYGFPAVDCEMSGVDCTARSVRVGLQGHFHPDPMLWYDPWFGAGIGYELSNLKLEHGNAQLDHVDLDASGFELFNVQTGLDFHVASHLSIGPFLSLSFNSYRRVNVDCSGQTCDYLRATVNDANPSIHEWLIFGVRGAFLLK